jgi:hypothetical protein
MTSRWQPLFARALLVSALVAGLGSAGCRCASSSTSEERRPLEGPASVALLSAKGEDRAEAIVEVPLGATEPRPLIVLLSSFEDPSAFAKLGKTIHKQRGGSDFVLTLRADPAEARPRLEQSIRALKERYSGYLAPRAALLSAEEQGGFAVALLREDPAFFSRAVLISPPKKSWSSTQSHVFGARGGERLLLVATREADLNEYDHWANMTRREGAITKTRLGSPEGSPPGLWEAVLLEELPWLLGGEGGWDEKKPTP